MSSVDWNAIRQEYEAGDIALKDLAEKHGVPSGTVRSRKKREGWQRNARMQRNDAGVCSVAETPKPDSRNKPHDDRPQRQICGARNRSGNPCQQAAGWGTDHPGTGRCKLHGGCSTGPPPEKMLGNKRALTTGEYETIWLDTLDPEEVELFRTGVPR